MDYPTTPALADRYTGLIKTQWDLIHNPQSTTGLFDGMEEGASFFDGTWTILDNKHTLLFNHVYENNREGNFKYLDKIAQKLTKNPQEESIDLDYADEEEKQWISQWKLRTASSDQILEKIIKKIQTAKGGNKIEKLTLRSKGIYIGKYKIDEMEYPVAIYSEKDVIDNITKVEVNEISELEKEENKKHIKAEETFIKYLAIAFYEDGASEPVLMMQIEKFDISRMQNTKEKWLMYLDILKLEKQEANKDKKPLPGDPLVNMEIVGTKIGDKSGGVFGCVRETSNNCGKFVNSEGYIKIINKNKMHDGFDLKASLFTPVYAMYDGTVEFSGDRKNALGICIYIISTPTQHKKSSYPIRITYCHLNRVLVKNRESIKQGQLIGYTGNTGNAKKILEWRYHLHLQVYNLTTGSKISPYKFLTTKFNKYNGENE